MSNEKMNQMIGEAYKEYVSTHENFEWTDDFCKKNLKDCGDQWDVFSQEEFINKCKTDSEFSEKWGLKIEERELSDGERLWICSQRHHISFGENAWYYPDNPDRDKLKWMTENQRQLCDYKNIPTRLITITYNNETIEVYE